MKNALLLFEVGLKLLITAVSLFLILLCYFWWNGGFFKGSGEELLKQHSSMHENKEIACKIEEKRIALYGDDLDVSFLRLYVDRGWEVYRKFHVLYENENGEKISFITYEFPLTMGIGAIVENTEIAIEETPDSIKIYYNKEPSKGFIVENNPFSKKIQFEFSNELWKLKKREGVCG